jgi:predicted homoserine dehydrogenase-like protein
MIGAALRQRELEGNPIKVAVVGAGRFGTSVIAQVSQMPGVVVAAIADRNATNLAAAWEAYGAPAGEIVGTDALGPAVDAIRAGRPVALSDAAPAPELPVDVLVEATGVTEVSAQICRAALEAGRHVVNVTVESEVAVGAQLARIARENGVVYSLADGDQPGVVNRLVDWARALGMDVIAAGRGTRRYPADRAGLPDGAFARYGYSDELVAHRRLSPQMYNSFRDGTKSQIEMCAVANVTGLVPDRPGMHEPSVGIPDLSDRFRLESQGGLLRREGIVDLANAISADGESEVERDIETGVFAVVRSNHPLIAEDMGFYGLSVAADGRAATIYRPYHLCGVETPLSIAEAALFGHTTGAPLEDPVADVVAVAKRDLPAGATLDGSGGATVSGYVVEWADARERSLLPLALAAGVTLARAVPAGRAVRYADIDPLPTGTLTELRALMGDRGRSDATPAPDAEPLVFPA